MKDLKVIVLSDEEWTEPGPLLIMSSSQREKLRPLLKTILMIMHEETDRLDEVECLAHIGQGE